MRFKRGRKFSRVEIIGGVNVAGKVAVEPESNDAKNGNEFGRYLIDFSKIILAVFVVDNIVTNRIMSSTEMFLSGVAVSLGLFYLGVKFNKNGGK